MVFPCSRILYLCFKSLGLDITSVFLNPFKMAATYLFLWFPFIKESCGRLIPSDTLCIEKVWPIPKCPFELETCSKWILSISISKIYLRSCSIYWSALTLDPCPEKWILSFLLELHHALHYNPTKREVPVEQNKWCRAKSTFIPI